MRNTLPLLSRPQPSSTDSTPTQAYPSIRLISATPSASGLSAAANSSPILPSPPSVAPFATQSPSALAPRESRPPRKRLVPKKSKLGLLGAVNAAGNKVKDKAGSKDFSDVVRRIGGQAASASAGKGFEIYVDQGDEKDVNEIVVVKKKKSRLGLDGMRWGSLGEVTNIPATSASKEKAKEKAPVEHLLKVKGEDSQRWWSIGRGRKDSKEKGKSKENKEQQPPSRATCKLSLAYS